MTIVTEAEVIDKLPSLLEETQRSAVIITNGEADLGAIVSMSDFKLIREAKAERFERAMLALGDELRACAQRDGVSFEELETMLDRKAS
jgi:hypothetical protein